MNYYIVTHKTYSDRKVYHFKEKIETRNENKRMIAILSTYFQKENSTLSEIRMVKSEQLENRTERNESTAVLRVTGYSRSVLPRR